MMDNKSSKAPSISARVNNIGLKAFTYNQLMPSTSKTAAVSFGLQTGPNLKESGNRSYFNYP